MEHYIVNTNFRPINNSYLTFVIITVHLKLMSTGPITICALAIIIFALLWFSNLSHRNLKILMYDLTKDLKHWGILQILGPDKPYRKIRGIFSMGNQRNYVGFVGIIFQRPTLDKLRFFSTHFVWRKIMFYGMFYG